MPDLEKLAEEGKLARQRVLDSINLAFKRLAEGAESLISNPQKLLRLVLSIVGLAAGIYLVRDFSRVLTEEVAKQLGKPSLIRDIKAREPRRINIIMHTSKEKEESK